MFARDRLHLLQVPGYAVRPLALFQREKTIGSFIRPIWCAGKESIDSATEIRLDLLRALITTLE